MKKGHIQTHGVAVGAGVWGVVDGCVEVGGKGLAVWAYTDM